MKEILLTNKYSGRPLDIVKEEVPNGFRISFLPEQTQQALEESVSETDYILAGGRIKITFDVLERARHLAMIQRSGVGLDALDLDAIRKKGIPLYVNQGVNTQSVAEHSLLLILACLRRLTAIHKNMVNGVWHKQEQGVQTSELMGKTVGIFGMGNVGQALTRLLSPFRVRILYTDQCRREDIELESGVRFVSREQLLRESDIVSLNCALTPETKGIINARSIAAMKPGAVLVNTARGSLVETEALAEALKTGKLSFAGIDVHETEPVPEDYPLRNLENVILTPHIAGVTEDSFRAMMHDAFRNIACFECGRLDEIEKYKYL